MRNEHKLFTVLITVMTSAWFSMSPPTAQAQDFRAGAVVISKPWSPPLPPVSNNGVVYLDLSNQQMAADRLITASTPVAGHVEFHTSVKIGSMMVMKKIQAVELPPHGNVALEPGGMHVMLIGLKNPLAEDTSFPLTLTFERAGTVTVDVAVKSPAAAQHAPAMQHNMSDGNMQHNEDGKHKH